MPRYRFDLAYNGRDYFGWQRQPKQISVQEEIEKALTRLNSNEPIQVVGCGRTDTGVHAHHYVMHADLSEKVDTEQYVFKLNRMLSDAISIHSMELTSDDFHARFGATERTYRYFIHQKKDPFIHELSWYFPPELDLDNMNKAAALLIGKKDFTSFSKLHTDVKTNICDLRAAKWIDSGDGRIYFEITADRFLRNMVRATVGTLIDVGLGKLQPEDVLDILNKKDRGEASTSVPPQGLFLWKISY
ncbi:MAG: tRNA pseudouridine(38-40) synthase TruA [Bacteroidetes bacterium]|nr:MAG: tRNA pseudouridine(38-40) synthase TruA [Bacteroidota bacterium]